MNHLDGTQSFDFVEPRMLGFVRKPKLVRTTDFLIVIPSHLYYSHVNCVKFGAAASEKRTIGAELNF